MPHLKVLHYIFQVTHKYFFKGGLTYFYIVCVFFTRHNLQNINHIFHVNLYKPQPEVSWSLPLQSHLLAFLLINKNTFWKAMMKKKIVTFQRLNSICSLTPLHISSGTDNENLLKNHQLFQLEIISLTVMTLLLIQKWLLKARLNASRT